MARDTAGVAEEYNVTYVPATFIIDQGGFICQKYVGAVQTRENMLHYLSVIIPELSSNLSILSFMSLIAAISILHKQWKVKRIPRGKCVS